jgi:hypothetical protein
MSLVLFMAANPHLAMLAVMVTSVVCAAKG